MGKVFKGANIVTSKDIFRSDIRIEGEVIEAIGLNLEKDGDEIIDLTGCNIIPGGIDAHTHFDMDSPNISTSDDFDSGTKAAIAGGTTTIIDFVNCHRGEGLNDSLDIYVKKTENKCYSDYGFHMTLCEWNDNIAKEMEEMVNKGITSFKMYMAYKGLQVNEEEIKSALKKAKELGAIILFHCESGDRITENIKRLQEVNNLGMKYHPISRPAEVELESVKTLIKISSEVDYSVYIVHLSSKLSLDAVREARKRGTRIFVETCPHYLLLNKEMYELKGDDNSEGAKYVMSPPLRDKEDNQELWKAAANGDIDIISTDHCSYNYKDKKVLGQGDFSKTPNGIPSVEHRIQLLYTNGVLKGIISLNKLVELTSTNPAKVFGLYPLKGEIAVGSHADFVVLGEDKKETIKAENSIQKVDYTPYEGFENKANIKMVYLRGSRVFDNGILSQNNPVGKYLIRKKWNY